MSVAAKCRFGRNAQGDYYSRKISGCKGARQSGYGSGKEIDRRVLHAENPGGSSNPNSRHVGIEEKQALK